MISCAGFAIHGTSNLVLQENVAFHVDGSCFYLEDGVEEQNVFQQNLAAFIHVIGVPASGPSQSGTTHYQVCLQIQYGLFQGTL